MTCRDCKHWGTVPYEYYDHDDQEPKKAEPHRICGAIQLLDPHEHRDGVAVTAFVRDGSGYMGELWTAPTFVCSLFEPSVSAPGTLVPPGSRT
jgi:hypothetical protein